MKKYNLENQIHFVTIDTHNKNHLFGDNNHCRIIIDNLKFYRNKFLFELYEEPFFQNSSLLLKLSFCTGLLILNQAP